MHKIHDTITQLAVPLDGLTPYGRNPRQGNVEAIKESLQHHGQYKPIVVRTGTNEILAGNHTAKAARELGWTDIAATFVDVTDDQAARIVLVDNRTNDLAGYDETALAELLDSLTDLDESGKSHEPVLYGFTPGANGRLGRGGPRWYGTNNRTTVFEVDKPPASRDHPTMKPVRLILMMMANSIRPGQIVLDPFAGSGSTLIAAEYHGAAARVVELDPVYCDVIAARYQKETGNLPIRAGQPVDFLGEE